MKKQLIFDFDGTLVDSMPTFSATMLKVVQSYGVSYPDNVIEIVTPLGYEGTAKYYIELGVPESATEIMEKMKQYSVEGYTYHIPAKETVPKTLAALKEKGYGLNVLTASPHVLLDPCLKRLGLYELFENVWSCDDFGTTKANPDIYRAAAARLGTTVENCIFLDDNINADKTAKSAGLTVIGVYDESSASAEAAIRAETDHYVKRFEELLEIL